MIVNEIRPQGFCHGVARALKIVKDAIFDESVLKPIHVLGLIVHNKKIKDALEHYNVVSHHQPNVTRLEMIDQINDGTVILTAHGSSDLVKEKLKEKNIPFIDATCKDVYKVHDQIKNNLNDYEIVYIGKKGHPEVEGVLGLSKEINLISSTNDAKRYKKKTDKVLYVTNQTTLSLFDVLDVVNELKKKHELVFNSDICMATTRRQGAVIKQPEADLLIVVGDSLSSNSNKLKEVSKKHTKIKTYIIETIEDINPNWLKDVKTVNVTSGASTPRAITKEVVLYLKQFDFKKKDTWDNVSKVSYLDILN